MLLESKLLLIFITLSSSTLHLTMGTKVDIIETKQQNHIIIHIIQLHSQKIQNNLFSNETRRSFTNFFILWIKISAK